MNPTDQPPAQTPPAPAPATAPAPRRRSRFWAITLQTLAAWTLYILSLGPLYWKWYEGKYVAGPTVIAALYEPLWILCGWFPPLAELVNWYVSLWIL